MEAVEHAEEESYSPVGGWDDIAVEMVKPSDTIRLWSGEEHKDVFVVDYCRFKCSTGLVKFVVIPCLCAPKSNRDLEMIQLLASARVQRLHYSPMMIAATTRNCKLFDAVLSSPCPSAGGWCQQFMTTDKVAGISVLEMVCFMNKLGILQNMLLFHMRSKPSCDHDAQKLDEAQLEKLEFWYRLGKRSQWEKYYV